MPVCLALTLVVVIDSWAAAEGQRDTGVLDPAAIQPEKGCCYVVSVKAPCAPDSQAGAQSFLRLLEEGRELGPAHSMHETIRESGGGAYSHWAGDPRPETQRLYFSASDNSDPRTNGKKYEWAVVYDGKGDPLPLRIRVPPTTSCWLTTLPDQPLVRDRHTCLLASFDAVDANDAEFARVERREVGVGSQPDAPGRFGGGVAVTGSEGCVMYPGLANYDPRRGTVEFWLQSRGDVPTLDKKKSHRSVSSFFPTCLAFPERKQLRFAQIFTAADAPSIPVRERLGQVWLRCVCRSSALARR